MRFQLSKKPAKIINFNKAKKQQKIKRKDEIITHLFKDKDKNQIFIKSFSNDADRYLIPEGAEKEDIKRSDNITLPITIDTEFTDYVGNLNKINLEDLERNDNKFKVQYEAQQNYLKRIKEKLSLSSDITIDNICSGLIKNIPVNFLEEAKNCKLLRNQQISTQLKHCLYEDGKLFFDPKMERLVKEYVGENESYYKENLHVIDYLKDRGIDANIKRLSSELTRKQFKEVCGKNEDGSERPTCTITIYAFFLLAELCKVFKGELLEDIKLAIRKKQIQMNRRVSTGMSKKYNPNWLIEINGETYKVAIDFADTGALQGNISFGDNLKNLEMESDTKDLMDDYKTNMIYGLLKYPEEWKKYALNDLKVYDVYKKNSETMEKVYEELKIQRFFTPPKMTIGSTVNNLTESMFLKHLGYDERNKENLKELYNFTLYGSPKKIGCYTTHDGKKRDKGEIRKKHTGAKTAGGRCFSNRQEILATTTNYTLCDIDISSAYTTIASSLNYYFGCPVVQSFKQYKVTLREFLKHYKTKIIDKGFKLIVETQNPLEFEQDLLVSFPSLRSKKKSFYDKEGNFSKSELFLDTDNIETAIYTKMLYNTPLSSDDLNIIIDSWNTNQKDDFLDKVTMVSAVYYPKELECKNVEELKRKQLEHSEEDNGRFKDTMKHSYIDNEDGELSHYWCSTNFGKLMMNNIIQLRRRNKKTNYSLSYLFKLIGNTVYGNAVSKHFNISNIVFASNITAMCRASMWCVEKTLNIHQTITDGGVFWLNHVLDKLAGKLDTSLLVRAYCSDKRELNRLKKWKYKPLTKNGEMIDFIDDKGWICDGELYPFDVNKVKSLDSNYEDLKEEFGENSKEAKEAKKILDGSMKGLNKFLKVINKLALDHVKKQFPKVDLFNGEFEKIKTDDEGIAERDDEGNFIYGKSEGLLEFEVKNICNWSVFHGSANYMYNNPVNKLTTKMRGYESKRGLLAVRLENDKIVFDEDYYNDISPTERFLTDIKNNPNNVRIPMPLIKQAILKINEVNKNYHKLWQHANLLPGDTMYKFITIPIYSMRHKFQTHEQHRAWTKYQDMLKRRGGGLSFEQFYINDDGTINYKQMCEDIDKHIREGVINPANVFDKDNNFFRDMKYKKNEKKYKVILDHIRLTTIMKNEIRLITVGVTEYCKDNMKKEKEGVVYLRKNLKNAPSDYSDDYENINKYSLDYEFEHKELSLAI